MFPRYCPRRTRQEKQAFTTTTQLSAERAGNSKLSRLGAKPIQQAPEEGCVYSIAETLPANPVTHSITHSRNPRELGNPLSSGMHAGWPVQHLGCDARFPTPRFLRPMQHLGTSVTRCKHTRSTASTAGATPRIRERDAMLAYPLHGFYGRCNISDSGRRRNARLP